MRARAVTSAQLDRRCKAYYVSRYIGINLEGESILLVGHPRVKTDFSAIPGVFLGYSEGCLLLANQEQGSKPAWRNKSGSGGYALVLIARREVLWAA
jgi:hypothetical protein